MSLNLKNIISLTIVTCVISIITIGINLVSYKTGFETSDGINRIKLYNADGIKVYAEIKVNSNTISGLNLIFKNSLVKKEILEANVSINRLDSSLIKHSGIILSDSSTTIPAKNIYSLEDNNLELRKSTQKAIEFKFEDAIIESIKSISVNIKLKTEDGIIEINKVENLMPIDVLQLNINDNSNLPLWGIISIIVLIVSSFIRKLLIKREKRNENN